MEKRSIALFFTEGSSDKEYHAAIEPKDGGFIVTFRYGRRGGPLKSGVKTDKPVSHDVACVVFDKLVKEKKGKGYTEAQSGAAFTDTGRAGERTAFRPQLLRPLTKEEAVHLVTNSAAGRWCMQRKLDGERRCVSIIDGEFVAANRKGLAVGVDERIKLALEALARSAGVTRMELDGEDLGDRFVAFNVLEIEGRRYDRDPFSMAAGMLSKLEAVRQSLGSMEGLSIELPTPVMAVQDMVRRMGAFEAAGEEGVVLRDMTEPSSPGRSASESGAAKVKFVTTATVRVRGPNGLKRSVEMEALDGGTWRGVGSVTVPPNQSVPEAGALIEVRYLYAFPGGSLFQPVLLRRRDDLDDVEATTAQFKFKAQTKESAA